MGESGGRAKDSNFITAALLDRFQPEFGAYLSGELIDFYLVPARTWRYAWTIPSTAKRSYVSSSTLARAIYQAMSSGRGRVYAETELTTSDWLARAYLRKLPAEARHLIVAQNFLPFLMRDGALEGRRFSVLLTRPPLRIVHERLEAAARLLPEAKSLIEYRAPETVVEAETEALKLAERVITPHSDFAKHFVKLRKLEWQRPSVVPPAEVRKPTWLLFPASLASREGAHAAIRVAHSIGMPLLVCGSDTENLAATLGSRESLVRFIKRPAQIPWNEIAAVVHPTLFEAWPRLHLYALNLGIPVITTEASGLDEGDGVTFVEFNDDASLERVLEKILAREFMLRDPRGSGSSPQKSSDDFKKLLGDRIPSPTASLPHL